LWDSSGKITSKSWGFTDLLQDYGQQFGWDILIKRNVMGGTSRGRYYGIRQNDLGEFSSWRSDIIFGKEVLRFREVIHKVVS
jgi:hypothetical protein